MINTARKPLTIYGKGTIINIEQKTVWAEQKYPAEMSRAEPHCADVIQKYKFFAFYDKKRPDFM